MNELQALYQEVLLDHYRSPRNRGHLAAATGRAEGHNPLCGDRIAVEVDVEGELACEATFMAMFDVPKA